jgi:hypothetical protein
MGQVALGFRSLLIKAAVFVVMAALLAWALGGTLWPRAETVDFEPVSFEGTEYRWRLSVGGRERGRARWRLMAGSDGEELKPIDERIWHDAAGPVVTDAGFYYAGRPISSESGTWLVERIDPAGRVGDSLAVPDRLAAERQLARVRAGLPLQNPQMIHDQRPLVLDPPARESAASGSE